MNGNNFMAWVLCSLAYGLLSGMMLITVIGCKTGKKYTLPVEYFEKDGYLWVVTSRDRTWWRNLRNGADVELLLKHKPALAHTDLVTEFEQVETHLHDYLRHAPMAAKPMGIRVQNKTPNDEDLARVAKERLFVRIKL
ncbi:MAG: nitroreductase family deazaflavin-dependent oxidoreductase, partial [Chloroflexi bacterium]|nr:nitroreductase family deazaflavin-dependent oxidoreductase [Chloroflexota bacterium]